LGKWRFDDRNLGSLEVAAAMERDGGEERKKEKRMKKEIGRTVMPEGRQRG
jgi:hypothetical protein